MDINNGLIFFENKEDICTDWDKCFLEPESGWDDDAKQNNDNGGSGSFHNCFKPPAL